MRRLDALLLAASLGSIGVLATLAEALEPPLVPIRNLDAHEGERVRVDARVLLIRHGERGRFLSLADETHRIDALAGPADGPRAGDVVRAVGIVAREPGGFVLSVQALDVVEAAGERPLSPAEIAARPEAFLGARVAVLAEARDGALVADGVRLRADGRDAPGAGWWLASGVVRYREKDASYAVAVDAWTRPS